MPASVKPAPKIDWPPKNYAFAQAVHHPAGFNWWSLAEMVGRDNPWDLIIFNFQTEDPQEINFYLKDYVGCKNLEGNNYIFFGANPGIIYIPPASWRPPTKYKKGSSRRNYSKYINRKTSEIIKKGAHVCPTITYHGITLTKSDLLQVARHIEAGDIDCAVAPEIRYDNMVALYDTKDNDFLFSKEPRHGNLEDLKAIIHEATHAAFDIKKTKNLYDCTNELFGFVVESIVAAHINLAEVERKLASKRFRYDDNEYYVYFFGWASIQKSKSRSILDLKTLDIEIEDPFRSRRTNPFNNLNSAIFHTYGWKKMLTKTKMDGV